MVEPRLLITDLEEIVQVCDGREAFKCGKQQDQLAIVTRKNDGTGCAIAIDHNGLISAIGYEDEMLEAFPRASTVIKGTGCSLIPGLVDPHTHPVWAGDRVFEFDLKLRGASYLDIHDKGGGIYYTVNETKKTTDHDLATSFMSRLDSMLACGTTLVEVKTGYGLDADTEMKMLRAIELVKKKGTSVDLVTNFLGAHAVPRNMTSIEGVNHVIEMMKTIRNNGFAVDFVDVFCEKGVFNVEESRKILVAGREIFGAEISFHGDELNPLGSAEMGSEIGAKAISHLEFISSTGIKAMAKSRTVAIICPTTAYLLKLKPPPVRTMINEGVPVAIGSDFNPNAFCYSLPMAMNIAAVECNMTLNEVLVGCTINAAFALNKQDNYGSLEVGKKGDCVLINAESWRHLVYQFGDTKSVIKHVIKNGLIVK